VTGGSPVIGRQQQTSRLSLRPYRTWVGESKVGVRKVVLHEYPDVEHLFVVQLTLPDVFAFFDEVARR
jgi:hypothetical protein